MIPKNCEVVPIEPASKGVVKLAWSWEATDVWVFHDVKELASQLRSGAAAR